MSAATCPGCGVPVVPGYVRCPKCHRPLASRNSRAPIGAGGTAVEDGGSGGLPLLPIIGGGVVALGIILYFVLGKSDAAQPKPAQPEAPVAEEPAVAEPDDAPAPALAPEPAQPSPSPSPNRIDPDAVARDLERALRNQRLWSSVEVVGKDVQLTSGSCRDANMLPTVNAAAQALRNAGLTRVRCLENSGAVVFERAL